MAGKLYLVGAGPGDPGLLTLKGKRCLEQADIVIYDYLANARLLDYARPDAERCLVGKHGGGVRVEQDTINTLIVDHARSGKIVVQLKGGDPFIFGRGGEEAEAAHAAGIERNDIIEATFVGNPVMHHLLLGINPIELGGAPFALATDRATTLRASDLGLALHPGARVFVLPCIAGHVGADAAGVVLAERPDLSEELTLLVDVGTNAEIVLGNRHRLLACSSPTGPAFEGAQISCGQRAAPGAIERVRIDPETLEPRFKVIGCDLWSDDPQFADATRRTGITGVCGSGIIEALAEMFLAGIILRDGTIDGDLAERSPRIRQNGPTFAYLLHEGAVTITITQNDVRAIQLAKAALYAGTRLLMDHLGVDAVDRIRLAGAFGSHIDVKYAMGLGMIPDCDLSQVSSAGNAAGTGARIARLDQSSRRTIEELVRRVEKIETAIEPKFQAHFVAAMGIPHSTAPSPNLRKAVQLPQPKAAAPRAGARTRRPPGTRP